VAHVSVGHAFLEWKKMKLQRNVVAAWFAEYSESLPGEMLAQRRAPFTAFDTFPMLIGIDVVPNDCVECFGESNTPSLRPSLSPPQCTRHLPPKHVSKNPQFRLTAIYPQARKQWQTQQVLPTKTPQNMI
jgi:hypothetical protein